MKTFADLKKAICGYTTRDEAAYVRDGFNCLNRAINDAKVWAQRTHIFERANVEVTIPSVSLTTGADLGTAVLRGTSTVVQVRTLVAAWLPNSAGTGEIPLDIVDRKAWIARQKRRYDIVGTNSAMDNPPGADDGYPLQVVFSGTKIHLSTANPYALSGATTTAIHFDAIQWLDEYEEDDDTDFFLDFAFDFLTMRSVFQLNAYLKEDQRVAVSEKVMQEIWLSVIRWDTSMSFFNTNSNVL